MGLDPEVSRLSRFALLVFLPWPAAIGYRRFYQGVMIRHGHTPADRLRDHHPAPRHGGDGVPAVRGADPGRPDRGGGALAWGVVFEAAATRLMAADCVRTVLDTPRTGDPLTTPRILRFYIPLLVSSVIRAGDPPAGEPVSRPLAPPPRVARHLSGGRLPLVRLSAAWGCPSRKWPSRSWTAPERGSRPCCGSRCGSGRPPSSRRG